MTIQAQLQQDMKNAMRAGDKQRLDVIRMAIAAIKNAQIAQVKQAYDAANTADLSGEAEVEVDRNASLSEDAVLDTLAKEVKRRREAALLYRQAKREDLAVTEDAEAEILETYLPRQMSLAQLRPLVATIIAGLGDVGPGDMGKVMPAVMQAFKGKADGRVINQAVKEILTKAK